MDVNRVSIPNTYMYFAICPFISSFVCLWATELRDAVVMSGVEGWKLPRHMVLSGFRGLFTGRISSEDISFRSFASQVSSCM
jgi:hypothetical protein